jgi:hypothetical protein
MAAPTSGSETIDTGSGSGIAGTGSQARQSSSGAETTSDVGQAEAYVLNMKRLVEEFLAESLTDQRARRVLFERLSQNALTKDEQLANVSLQALQNAVETANMVGKQAVRHGDIAIDRQWNLDEVASDAVANTAALADMLKRTFGTTEMAEIIRGVVASEMARNRTA